MNNFPVQYGDEESESSESESEVTEIVGDYAEMTQDNKYAYLITDFIDAEGRLHSDDHNISPATTSDDPSDLYFATKNGEIYDSENDQVTRLNTHIIQVISYQETIYTLSSSGRSRQWISHKDRIEFVESYQARSQGIFRAYRGSNVYAIKKDGSIYNLTLNRPTLYTIERIIRTKSNLVIASDGIYIMAPMSELKKISAPGIIDAVINSTDNQTFIVIIITEDGRLHGYQGSINTIELRSILVANTLSDISPWKRLSNLDTIEGRRIAVINDRGESYVINNNLTMRSSGLEIGVL